MKGERLGIALILVQQLFFTLDTAAIHHLGGLISIWQLGLLRSIGGLGLVACLAPSVGWSVYRTHHPGLQAIRATVTVAYGWVTVYSFAVMPFADATAIAYTYAIYVALLAPLILGEIVGSRRYLAIAIGAIGAMLIVKPGFSQASLIYLGVLIFTSLNAIAIILNKYLQQKGESPVTVMLYIYLAMFPTFAPGITEPWPFELWPWLIAACVTGPLGMYAGILAVRHADTTTLAPFTYVRLLLATAGASLMFGEPPDIASISGATAIVVACVLSDRQLMTSISSKMRFRLGY